MTDLMQQMTLHDEVVVGEPIPIEETQQQVLEAEPPQLILKPEASIK